MKSIVFYLLLYTRPFAGFVLRAIGGFSLLGAIVLGAGQGLNGFELVPSLVMILLVIVSFGAFVLKEKYTDVLLRLQPEGAAYSFYD